MTTVEEMITTATVIDTKVAAVVGAEMILSTGCPKIEEVII